VPCQELFLVWHRKIRATNDTDSLQFSSLLFTMLRLVFRHTTKLLRSLRVYIHLFEWLLDRCTFMPSVH